MFIVLLTVSGAFVDACAGSEVLETWETTNGSMRVRVRKFPEWPPLNPAPNYFFRLDVATPEHDWREVFEWSAGSPIKIPREHVGFVNERIVFAYGNFEYVVTLDGGSSWTTWNAYEVPGAKWAGIMSAHVTGDGKGELCLQYKIQGYEYRFSMFESQDFGRHWT